MSEQQVIAELLKFPVGTRVIRFGEDSQFEGVIVAAFTKRNGKAVRYVIENDQGVLHITSGATMRAL